MDDAAENRVVLTIDTTKILLSAKTAFAIFELLAKEELLVLRNDYKKDDATGQWGTVKRFDTLSDSERCSIGYMPAVEYMLRRANTDKSTD